MICDICNARGLKWVHYHSGEPSDIAICGCRFGQYWRNAGEDFIRALFSLSGETRVGYLEHFDDESEPSVDVPAIQDFIAAGRVERRAKL